MDNQRFLSDALEQLKPYLLSHEVFWNLGKDPQLTLGNLLLAVASLQAAGALRPADAGALAAAQREWGSAWEKKAEREFAARLRLWSAYLEDLGEKPSQHASYYAGQVRHRVLLQLLAAELPALSGQLAALDSRLRALTSASGFVWEPGLEPAFPKDDYWFLWVKPNE